MSKSELAHTLRCAKLTFRLISLGYKVGVISQTETAALKKVSDNRNAPFTRRLTHLFTAATYVEDAALGSASTMLDDPVVPGSAPPPTNALVALVEIGMGGMALDERVRIGLVSVVPETGDVVWDEFDGQFCFLNWGSERTKLIHQTRKSERSSKHA
jgi:DNA mismatch repair protein MSH3